MTGDAFRIRLQDHQRRGLERLAGVLNVSVAALVRGMVDDYLKAQGAVREHASLLAGVLAAARGQRVSLLALTGGTRRKINKRKLNMRERLPIDREGITHHFTLITATPTGTREIDGYVQVGLYPDGRVGEVFIKCGKSGDDTAMLDQFAIAFSVALQHGAPFGELCQKFIGSRFEPSGATKNRDIPRCSSPVDYVCRFLLARFGKLVETTNGVPT